MIYVMCCLFYRQEDERKGMLHLAHDHQWLTKKEEKQRQSACFLPLYVTTRGKAIETALSYQTSPFRRLLLEKGNSFGDEYILYD